MNIAPTEADVRRILQEALAIEAVSIRRFPTGLANWVYDVLGKNGEAVAVRLTLPESKKNFEGAVRWYGPLTEKGVPLPALRYVELGESKHGFPVMVMDRLPGIDLGDVYGQLGEEEKRDIAYRVAELQSQAETLPVGQGYGYGSRIDDPALHPTWQAALAAHIDRSRQRLGRNGVFPARLADAVESLLDRYGGYLSAVQPVCFLDDTTTKNVIIHEGRLSGIVDVDGVTFGDPLFAVALTKMALLSAGHHTSYVDYWLEAIAATDEQRAALNLYVAVFCLDFMSEMGMAFNKSEAGPVDAEKADRLLGILDDLMAEA